MSEPKLDKFGEPYYIWLQLYGDGSREDGPVPYDADGVTWCWHQIHSSDLKYIRAGVKHTNQIAEIASLRAQHTEQAAEIFRLRAWSAKWRTDIGPPFSDKEYYQALNACADELDATPAASKG